ncbi:GNAT family N-acetyltransferase [Erysipelotrichaceae bacterium HCN-30851]
MKCRLAVKEDLPQIISMFENIIQDMSVKNINIWDEEYPCNAFEEDILLNRLYVVEEDVIVSAFVLCDTDEAADSIKWKHMTNQAMYLSRFGVHVNYAGKGIGSFTLLKVKEIAKQLNADCIRLFVANINEPACRLYEKEGFTKAEGIYDLVIDEDYILHEYGYEIKI